MNILYYDNCWFTNVGEAFVDIGAIEIIKKLYPTAKISTISNMSNYYVLEKEEKNFFKKKNTTSFPFQINMIPEVWNYDMLILAGMFMSETHLNGKVSEFVRLSKNKGAQIAFIGLGEEPIISEKVINDYRGYLCDIKPKFITTRDKKTFSHLQNIEGVENLICGIDAAFWVKNAFDPRGFSRMKYDVVSFNRSSEPDIFENWDKPIIRPWHMQWASREMYFSKETFVSDIPYDYISIYANSDEVYTDLVHASIISLQYGKKVRFIPVDSRKDAVLDLGIIKNDGEKIYVEESELEALKSKILEEIKEKLR